MHELAFNQITFEFRISLKIQEIAEWLLCNIDDCEVSTECILNAKSVFGSSFDNHILKGVNLAKMVILNTEMAELGMNDGSCFRNMQSKFIELAKVFNAK